MPIIKHIPIYAAPKRMLTYVTNEEKTENTLVTGLNCSTKYNDAYEDMFYKGDMIVDTEDGYFNIYAENLNGRVRQMWLRSGCTVRTMTGSNMCMSRDSQSFNNTGILLSAGIMPITGIIILLHLLEKVLMSS